MSIKITYFYKNTYNMNIKLSNILIKILSSKYVRAKTLKINE